MKLVGTGASAVELCQNLVAIGEHCDKINTLFGSSQLLALFCSELKSEVNMVWLDLVALIPLVDTFLESCIQLAKFDINHENHETSGCDNCGPASILSSSTSTTSWFNIAYRVVTWPFIAPFRYLSNLRKTPVHVTPKEFDRLFDDCIKKWEPIPKQMEDFLNSRLKSPHEKYLSQHQEALKLESLRMCQCKCCGGLGALATVATAIVTGAISVPEKLPAAVAEMVEPEMFKYAWCAALALIILVGICMYSAYSAWMCTKECQQIINSLKCIRDEMQEMQKILKTTRNHGKYCIEYAIQVRDKLGKPNKDELNELMEQIHNDATQLKCRLKKLFKERNA